MCDSVFERNEPSTIQKELDKDETLDDLLMHLDIVSTSKGKKRGLKDTDSDSKKKKKASSIKSNASSSSTSKPASKKSTIIKTKETKLQNVNNGNSSVITSF